MPAAEDTRFQGIPRKVIIEAIRTTLDQVRSDILAGRHRDTASVAILTESARLAAQVMKNRLIPLVNATGVVLHTNLGRALLCQDALENIRAVSGSYSNLELNLSTGKRGIRYAAVESLICELTGAESAIAVNNNAGCRIPGLKHHCPGHGCGCLPGGTGLKSADRSGCRMSWPKAAAASRRWAPPTGHTQGITTMPSPKINRPFPQSAYLKL